MLNLKEEDVQKLIAEYPWLLDIDYEIVPELRNKGMEYVLSDNKRTDLILRDRVSRRPIIVEFKANPFYRENIGQILEYKARVISEYTKDSSILKDIFGERLFTPIMILVVPSCADEARLACNLSGIEIYEYENTIHQILVPEKMATLEDFKNRIDNKDIPFSMDREESVDRIYDEIRDVLNTENLLDGWTQYKKPSGEYFTTINHLFVNKYLFQGMEVCIGIYEDIFHDDMNDKVIIEFYSKSKKALQDFITKYRELNLAPLNADDNIDKVEFSEYYWSFILDKKEFFSNTKEMVKPFIENYKVVTEHSGN